MNLKFIGDFFSNLKNYSKPVVPNLRPKIVEPQTIVPLSCYEGSAAWKGIVIHHSATKDGKTNDWDAIKKYHTSYRVDGRIVDEASYNSIQMLGHSKSFEKPWSDIGYHGGWELEGDVYVFKMGRPWGRVGAHAGLKGNNHYNNAYLGLCAVGGFDKAIPAKELWDLALATVREISAHFGFGKEQVIGHREVYDRVGTARQKTCPGTLWDMNKFRQSL